MANLEELTKLFIDNKLQRKILIEFARATVRNGVGTAVIKFLYEGQ